MKEGDRMNGSLKTNEESVDELLLLQKKVIATAAAGSGWIDRLHRASFFSSPLLLVQISSKILHDVIFHR